MLFGAGAQAQDAKLLAYWSFDDFGDDAKAVDEVNAIEAEIQGPSYEDDAARGSVMNIGLPGRSSLPTEISSMPQLRMINQPSPSGSAMMPQVETSVLIGCCPKIPTMVSGAIKPTCLGAMVKSILIRQVVVIQHSA